MYFLHCGDKNMLVLCFSEYSTKSTGKLINDLIQESYAFWT